MGQCPPERPEQGPRPHLAHSPGSYLTLSPPVGQVVMDSGHRAGQGRTLLGDSVFWPYASLGLVA